MTVGPAGKDTNASPQNYRGVPPKQEQVGTFKEAINRSTTSNDASGTQYSKGTEHSQATSKSLPIIFATRPPINLGNAIGKQGAPLNQSQAPAAPAGTDDVALGDLSSKLEESKAKLLKLDDQLRRIDVALADPSLKSKHAELKDLKRKLEGEKKTETPKRDALQKQLDGALATPGSARDGVGKTYGRLESVNAQLAKANEQLSATARKVTAKVTEAEAEAAKHKTGIAHPKAAALANEAAKLGKEMKALEKKIASLESAKTALTNEVQAREPKALAEAKSSNDPAVRGAAKDSVDVTDLASTKREQQVKVLGAPVVGVSAQKAVEADVGRIALAQKNGGAANGAEMLALQLGSGTKEHQDALVKAASGQIASIASAANGDAKTADKLVGAISKAEGTALQQLTLEVGKQVTGMDSQVIQTLDAKMKNGEGLDEAYELASGLRRAGKKDLADKLDGLIETRVTELSSNFEKASEKIAGVKGDLGRLTAGFGPLLGAKQQEAMNAFKARHAGEFEAWEASGAKLANAAKFLEGHSRRFEKAYEQLPEACETIGGQKVVAAAVKDLAAGKPSFLENAKDIGKLGKYAPQLVVKSIGQEALNLAAAGKTEEAKKVLDQLKAAGGVMKVEGKKIDGAIDALKNVVDGKPGAVEAFDKELRKVKADAGAFNALKGLAWATSVMAGIEHLGSDKLKTQVKGMTEIISPTGESVAWGLQAIVDAKKTAWTEAGLIGRTTVMTDAVALSKTVGGFASAFGAVLDGVSAVQSFKNGELMDGTGSTMSAIGGAVLAVDTLAAAAGMQVVPVWGQIAGAALVIGGTIVKGISAERKAAKKEKAAEDDAEAYLVGGGVDPKKAETLSDVKRADGRNVGMMIMQIAPAMGMTPQQLWAKVQQLPAGKMQDFIDMAKDLPIGKDGKVPANKGDVTDVPRRYSQIESTDPDGRVSETVRYYPQSLETAAAWTKKFFSDNGI